MSNHTKTPWMFDGKVVYALNAGTGIQTEPPLMPVCFNVDRSELERKLGQETMKYIDDCNAITRELYNEAIKQRNELLGDGFNNVVFDDFMKGCAARQTAGGTGANGINANGWWVD